MKRNKVVATYDYYTLEQARNILTEEIKQEYKRKIAQKRRKERAYFLKQKCVGAMMIFATSIFFLVTKNIFLCFPFYFMGFTCFTKLHLIYE